MPKSRQDKKRKLKNKKKQAIKEKQSLIEFDNFAKKLYNEYMRSKFSSALKQSSNTMEVCSVKFPENYIKFANDGTPAENYEFAIIDNTFVGYVGDVVSGKRFEKSIPEGNWKISYIYSDSAELELIE